MDQVKNQDKQLADRINEFATSFYNLNIAILERKNHDYTNARADPFSNFTQVQEYGIATVDGFITRMSDKLMRIDTFLNCGELKVQDETVMDTLGDLANYSMLMAAYLNYVEGGIPSDISGLLGFANLFFRSPVYNFGGDENEMPLNRILQAVVVMVRKRNLTGTCNLLRLMAHRAMTLGYLYDLNRGKTQLQAKPKTYDSRSDQAEFLLINGVKSIGHWDDQERRWYSHYPGDAGPIESDKVRLVSINLGPAE